MIAIALIVLSTLGAVEAAPDNNEAVQETPTEQTVEVEQPKKQERVETPKPDSQQVTWRDNPNQCTDKQWIAKEPPHECIDKPVAKPKQRVASVSTGSWIERCKQWASEAGVVLNEAAITLISRESKCDPSICNPNGIACGIPQALPWTKMGCSLTVADAGCQLKWMEQYVKNRYGSWQAALNHSYANNWY